jgi:hypothetical protein
MDSTDNASKADQNAKLLIEKGEISLGAYLYEDFKRFKDIDGKASDTPQTKEPLISKTKSAKLASKLGASK